MNKNPTTPQDYYSFIQDMPMLSIQNKGLAIQDNKTQAGLSFNTGQMYNKTNQQVEASTPNMAFADGTKTQSNFVNLKNQQRKY